MLPVNPNELIQIKKYIDEGNHDFALKLMIKFEKERKYSLQDNINCRLLKCKLLFQQGLFEELLDLVEKIYIDSLELGKNILSFDSLMWEARALLSLFKLSDVPNIIKKGEDLLKSLSQELKVDYTEQEASLAFIKALFYYWENRNANLALEQLTHSLALRKRSDNYPEIILTNLQIAKILIYGKGDVDTASNYLEDGITLAKEINNKFNLAWGFLIKAASCYIKGDLDQSIQLNEQSLKLYTDLNNYYMMGNVLNNMADVYKLKGELDQSLELMEERFTLRFESGNVREIAIGYDPLIQIYIQKGDIAKAQEYLEKMEKLIIKLNDKQINRWYLFDKALILKTSLRAEKRIKAEKILKKIIEDEDSDNELNVRALLNLCELLLIELQITSEIEVLEDVKSIISKLMDTAEKIHSYWIWGETFVLQAQLALLSLNLKEARRLLMQGQKIAEKYGLKSLAIKISNKHDELLHRLNLWEELKDLESPLSDRLKLTELGQQIKTMIQKPRNEIPEIIKENPIMILIITQGGILTFSKLFTENFKAMEDLMSSFLSAFNNFSGELFSEGLDRASFGEYTLLMKPISTFLVCYLFKGQSYLAQKKINQFVENLEQNKELLEKFNEFYKTYQVIRIEDLPLLKTLITDIFIEKKLSRNHYQ